MAGAGLVGLRSWVRANNSGGLLLTLRCLSAEGRKSTIAEEPTIKLKPEEEATKKFLMNNSPPPSPAVASRNVPSILLNTHEAVVKLQNAGCSVGQAEALVSLLVDCQTDSVAPLHKAMVVRQDLDFTELRMKTDLKDLYHHLVVLENTKLLGVQEETKVVRERVEKLMSGFKEEVVKVQSNLQLDLNLEKGRIKEEAGELKQQVKDIDNKIDREVAHIRMQIETQKFEFIKYFSGGILTLLTIVMSACLGIYRILK